MKIELLYPEVCCLYGDLMNAEYLCRCIDGAELVKTPLGEKPLFLSGGADAAFLCSMPEYAQLLVRDKFAGFMDEFKAAVDRGAVFLATGNAPEVFYEYIEDKDGTRTDMLGMFPLYAKRDLINRYNSLYLGKFGDDIDIVGFKSQFCHAYGQCVAPLFHTVRGAGHNPDDMDEGFRVNNFMGTAVLGPLVVLNPPFAKYLLGLLGAEQKLACEKAALDAYDLRLREFSEPDRGFSY